MPNPYADHFSAIAARYAAYRPRYPAALADLLRAETRGDVVWDVGCGNGQLSVALGARFAKVIATDLTARQLAEATPHPHVEYRCAPAEASGLPDASVDLVVAAQAAHWFDWPRFVAEVARVARPGALVALVTYGRTVIGPPGDEAARVLAEFHDRHVEALWPPGREHVENGYRDLVLPWPAVPAPALEMTAEWTRDELAGYVSSWSAVARLVEQGGEAAFEAFRARLAQVWPDGERRTIRWPLAIKLARR